MASQSYSLTTILCITIPLGTVALVCLLLLFILALRFSCVVNRLQHLYDFEKYSKSRSSKRNSVPSLAHSTSDRDLVHRTKNKRPFIDILCCIPPEFSKSPAQNGPKSKVKLKTAGTPANKAVSGYEPRNPIDDNGNLELQYLDPTSKQTNDNNEDIEKQSNTVEQTPQISSNLPSNQMVKNTDSMDRAASMKPVPSTESNENYEAQNKAQYATENALGFHTDNHSLRSDQLDYSRASELSYPISLGLKGSAVNFGEQVQFPKIYDTTPKTHPYAPGTRNGPAEDAESESSVLRDRDIHDLPAPPVAPFQSSIKPSIPLRHSRREFSFSSPHDIKNIDTRDPAEDLEELIPPVKSALRPRGAFPTSSQISSLESSPSNANSPTKISNRKYFHTQSPSVGTPSAALPQQAFLIRDSPDDTLSSTPMLTPLESFGQWGQSLNHSSNSPREGLPTDQSFKTQISQIDKSSFDNNKSIENQEADSYAATAHGGMQSSQGNIKSFSGPSHQLNQSPSRSFESEFLRWAPTGYQYYHRPHPTHRHQQQDQHVVSNQAQQQPPQQQQRTQVQSFLKGLNSSKEFILPQFSNSKFKLHSAQENPDRESSITFGARDSTLTTGSTNEKVGKRKKHKSRSGNSGYKGKESNEDRRDRIIALLQRDENIRSGSERIGRTRVEQGNRAILSYTGSVIGPENNGSLRNINSFSESAWADDDAVDDDVADDDAISSKCQTPTDKLQSMSPKQTNSPSLGYSDNYENDPPKKPSKMVDPTPSEPAKDSTLLKSPLSMPHSHTSSDSRTSSLASLSAMRTHKERIPQNESMGSIEDEAVSAYPDLETIRRPDALKISGSIRNIASLQEPATPRSPGYQPGQNIASHQGHNRAPNIISLDTENRQTSSRGLKGSEVALKRRSTFAYGNKSTASESASAPEPEPEPASVPEPAHVPAPVPETRDVASHKPKVGKTTRVNKPLPSTPFLLEDGVITNLGGARFTAVLAYSARLSDELDLDPGDLVKVYEVFDDGWCLARISKSSKSMEGRNTNGVCPRACLTKHEG